MNIFFFKLLEDIIPFHGATVTPVLDFRWCLPCVSKPGWIPVHYTPDTPLVRLLLTVYRSAWQLGLFDPRTCRREYPTLWPIHIHEDGYGFGSLSLGFPPDWFLATVVPWRNIHTVHKYNGFLSLNISCTHFLDRIPFPDRDPSPSKCMWISHYGPLRCSRPRQILITSTQNPMAICCHLSLCRTTISIQSYISNFLSVTVSASVSDSVNKHTITRDTQSKIFKPRVSVFLCSVMRKTILGSFAKNHVSRAATST